MIVSIRLPKYRAHKGLENIRMAGIGTLLMLFSLGFLSYAFAAQYNDLKFDHLTVEDGLPSNQITDVLQDRQGFLWFATKQGLVKYDAAKYTVYTHKPNDPESLGNNYVWRLMEASDGSIWIGTWGGGLDRFDPATETFTHYIHDPNNPDSIAGDCIEFIYEDRQGDIWIAVYQGGIARFNPDTQTFTRYIHEDKNPNSIARNFVKWIQEDEKGNFWLAFFFGGADRFDPKTKQFTHYQFPHQGFLDTARVIHKDRTGQLWIGTGSGLQRYDPATDTFIGYTPDEEMLDPPGTFSILTIHEDRQGIFWLGTYAHGLLLFDPGKGEFIAHYQPGNDGITSVSNLRIFDIFEDNQGICWLGTRSGIDRYIPWQKQITVYNKQTTGLRDQKVNEIYQDETGVIWIGTQQGGLSKFDRKHHQLTNYTHRPDNPDSISHDTVQSIVSDNTGGLWIGTLGGLNRFDPATETFTCFVHDPENPQSLNSDYINDIALDSKGNLWLAIGQSGLSHFNPLTGKFTNYIYDSDTPDGIVAFWAYCVYVDSRDNVWVGTEGGLSRFDPANGTFTNFHYNRNNPNRLSDESVCAIAEDEAGMMWFGTNNGLNRYNETTRTFKRYFMYEGLPGNRIVSIVPTANHILWLGTNKGISKFNTDDETFRNYDARDGFMGNDFIRGAAFMGHDGELFFGGTHGFNSFFPQRLSNNPHAPDVVFTDFRLFNKPVKIGKDSPLPKQVNFLNHLTLSHEESVFSIEFAALNFDTPDKNRYAYKMDGFDKDWTYTDMHRRFAIYTNLDPGDYIFRVKAANNDGVWNEKGKSLGITITPPWWGTLWFKSAVLMMIAAILGFGYRFRIRTLEIRRQALEGQVASRTAKLRDSETRFASVMNSMEAIMYVADMETFELLFINEYTRKRFGNVEGKICWRTLQKGQTGPCGFCTNPQLMKDGRPTGIYTWEFQNTVTGCWYHIQDQAIQWIDGRFVRLEIATDITNLKQAKDDLQQAKDAAEAARRMAENANQSKSEFLANMSHELRTPLNAILGFTGIMVSNPKLPPEEKDNLSIIQRSGNHLLAVINQVLDFSKIEADCITLNEDTVDLIRLLSEVSDIFSLKAGEKGLRLSVDTHPAVPRYVRTDGMKLRQVLFNVLNNAIKFTNEGGIIIIVTAKVKDKQGADASHLHLFFEIEDTGSGIAPEEMDTLFEAFTQTESGRKIQEGTGLGLPISQKFIRLMGGDITAESKMGHGTTFRFDIKVAAANETCGERLHPKRRVVAIEPGQPCCRVLIVDDNPDNRALLLALLKPFGFGLRDTDGGREAIAVFKEWQPHLILMDLRMPVMDGYDTIKQIQSSTQFCQSKAKPVIIAVTAGIFEKEREKVISSGFQDLLHKPFQEQALVELLEKYLNMRFIYEETREDTRMQEKSDIKSGEKATSVSMKSLSQIPDNLLGRLKDAAALAEMDSVETTIEEIREIIPSLADQLSTLANNFEYKKIAELIESARHR